MKLRRLRRIIGVSFLFFSAMYLTACGGPQTYSWPGLAVSGNTAYFAYNQYIAAINVGDGQQLWKYPDAADSALMFYSNPWVDSQGHLSAGSYYGSVVSLDAGTGKLLWKFDGGKTKIYGPVLQTTDSLIVSSEDGKLHFLNPDNGTEGREINLGQSSWGSMAGDAQHIYIATLEHWVYALDASTGAILWKHDAGTAIAGGLTLADGKLLMGTSGGNVVALDASTGNQLWKAAASNWVWGAPAVDDKNAYFADLSGIVHAVSLDNGHELWKMDLAKPVTARTVLADGVLYVGVDDGTVHAVTVADQSAKWVTTPPLEGGVHGAMVLAGDRLLVTLTGGSYPLAALSLDNGSVLWKFDGVK